MTSKPVVLVILDGWGVTVPTPGNAVTSAHLSYWDFLLARYPTLLLQASGPAVGLPWGKMGNSEVGHLTLGSGQIFLQSLDRINRQISSGEFFENPAFLKAINHVKNNNSKLHLIGLLGDGGVHAHENHLYALLELAGRHGLHDRTFLHLFLDGRDTSKDSGLSFLEKLTKNISHLSCGQLSSIAGRFFGMDRNENWDRLKLSYDAMVGRAVNSAADPLAAVKQSYASSVYDEEFAPLMIVKDGQPVGPVAANDSVIFFNFRSDRARQLTRAFVSDNFSSFDRGDKISNLFFVGFSAYESNLPIEVAFSRLEISNPLAGIISAQGLSQLHLAETEKYAHVTFFFNGLKEQPFPGEQRLLVPSPAVSSYDTSPEMSACLIRDELLKALGRDEFQFIVVNFANPDMVGHTGNLSAAVKALETVDNCLSAIIPEIQRHDGQVIVTADHGNCEEMINLETGAIDKEHSNFPVPCLLIKKEFDSRFRPHRNAELFNLKVQGALVDIAPTILSMLGLPREPAMIGIDLQKIITG